MHTHFRIFVEDASGKKLLDILMQKLIPQEGFSYTIHAYKGCGNLPKSMTSATQIRTQTLLNNIPRLISGFLNSDKKLDDYKEVFVIVTDCDNKECGEFKRKIVDVITNYAGSPVDNCIICLAIEEMEAWLLDDYNAIKQAYPKANKKEYDSYIPDSICGTWEKLFKIINEKEFKRLKNSSSNVIGIRKSEWAEQITPHIDVDSNRSPSFNYYIKKIREYIYT